MKFTAIDLFCGVGGTSEALKNKFEKQCAVEFDPITAETYAENHGSAHLITKDINRITKKEFLNKTNLSLGQLDLLIATPPCQGFSRHSRKKSKDQVDYRNKLIFHLLRVSHYFHPKYIFFENVGNIVNHKYFLLLLKKLSNIDVDGYPINKTKPSYHLRFEVVNAANYNVPQKRKRLILLGKKINYFPLTSAFLKTTEKGIPIIMEPLKVWPEHEVAPLLGNYLKPYNLKSINAGETDPEDELHTSRNLSNLNIKRLNATPHNGGSRNSWPEELWLNCHKKKKVSYGDVYGRMDYNNYSPTITCGCVSLSKGRFGHPVENRAISLREAALIQTFPKDYIFKGSIEKKATQIGNAVPVNLAKAFIKVIYEDLLSSGTTA
ncbi:DNA cytosine methyltransferase [Longirhabdus pacifica]|uniref:DNA cytosine methyltransferase n=1 Tax=Longirhabdus pacifica TaxID=2305227 RepID=UPI0013E8ECB3|nr:DNA cytosine methyltransferase [Longirhabdus pacifica]